MRCRRVEPARGWEKRKMRLLPSGAMFMGFRLRLVVGPRTALRTITGDPIWDHANVPEPRPPVLMITSKRNKQAGRSSRAPGGIDDCHRLRTAWQAASPEDVARHDLNLGGTGQEVQLGGMRPTPRHHEIRPGHEGETGYRAGHAA